MTASIRLSFVAISAALLFGCASQPKQEMTSLEIQSFQSQEFEAPQKIVFGAVMSVFQDLGYIIESADFETGFITSASASENKTGFWAAMGGVAVSGKTRATAFVEPIGVGNVKVRLNFVDTMNQSSGYGQSSSRDTPIMEPEPYKVAFDKIGEAVFIRLSAQ